MALVKIVISGTSILSLAVEAGLAALPEIEVTRIDLHLPGAMACIEALDPDVIIVEGDGSGSAGLLDLPDHSYPLIELDSYRDLLAILNDCQRLVQRAKPLAQEHQEIKGDKNHGPITGAATLDQT